MRPLTCGAIAADFELLCTLGRGSHGVVHKARSRRDGGTYVLKEVQVKALSEAQRREAVSEVLVMRRLRHPHIVRYYTCFVENQALYIVLEYAAMGDLQSLLDRAHQSGKHIPEQQLWRFMWQLAQARRALAKQRTALPAPFAHRA